MGRIKTVLVKRISRELINRYSGTFKPSFEENKPLVSRHIGSTSKKMRNIIAGYVTRLVRRLS